MVIAFAREGADIAMNFLAQEHSDAQHILDAIGDTGGKVVALPGDIRVNAVAPANRPKSPRHLFS